MGNTGTHMHIERDNGGGEKREGGSGGGGLTCDP